MITDEQIEIVTELLIDSDLCQEDVRKALEAYEKSKPKPEPVGYAWVVNNRVKMIADTELNSGFIPLYTTHQHESR